VRYIAAQDQPGNTASAPFLPVLNHEATHKWPSSPDLIGRSSIPALIAGHGFGANLVQAYLWLEPPRRCSTGFINVNLVEATNRFSHFQFIATPAFAILGHASV
jgi:hypothetical protein